MLKKYKGIEIEFCPVYFNSTTKTVINNKFDLDKSFQEILCRIDNWINESPSWIVESIKSLYINVLTFRPLMGSSCMKLPLELKSPKQVQISIENKDQRGFCWCHIRHIKPIKIHPERITWKGKELTNVLNYVGIKFPVSENDFSKIEMKNNICINAFCYENKLTFSIYISDQKFENSMDLLLFKMKTSHIMCTLKIFTDLCFTKQKIKIKNTFTKVVCSVLVVKVFWTIMKKFVWVLMVHNL